MAGLFCKSKRLLKVDTAGLELGPIDWLPNKIKTRFYWLWLLHGRTSAAMDAGERSELEARRTELDWTVTDQSAAWKSVP